MCEIVWSMSLWQNICHHDQPRLCTQVFQKRLYDNANFARGPGLPGECGSNFHTMNVNRTVSSWKTNIK
jgi:hypothetical protein